MKKLFLIILLLGSVLFAAAPSPGPVSTFTVDLQPNWNMISVPLANAVVVENTCTGGVFYGFNPLTAHYVKGNINSDIQHVMRGFWFKNTLVGITTDSGGNVILNESGQPAYLPIPCHITFSGNQFGISDLHEGDLILHKGWNMIGSPSSSVLWADIKGSNCKTLRGPLFFNVNPDAGQFSNQFQGSDTLDSGRGYFVKVERTCALDISSKKP